jgi:hypothetical protein
LTSLEELFAVTRRGIIKEKVKTKALLKRFNPADISMFKMFLTSKPEVLLTTKLKKLDEYN